MCFFIAGVPLGVMALCEDCHVPLLISTIIMIIVTLFFY